MWVGPSAGGPGDNWPDTGRVPGPERVLTRARWACVETLTTRSEPKGKLDIMATQPATMLAAVAVVNGPEDEPLDWHVISWRAVEEDVRRLRQRICTGLLEPDARKAC